MKLKILSVLITTAAMLTVSGSAGAQSAGISDDVVKIGALTDMSGQFSHEAGEGAVTAIKMAVEDFGGKVLGKPIEVVVADHQNKPDTASALTRKWFDVDHVDMIGTLINSSIALTVSGLAKEKNRIAIINGSGSPTSEGTDQPSARAAIRQPFPRTEDIGQDRKSTRLNSSHLKLSRMPSSA